MRRCIKIVGEPLKSGNSTQDTTDTFNMFIANGMNCDKLYTKVAKVMVLLRQCCPFGFQFKFTGGNVVISFYALLYSVRRRFCFLSSDEGYGRKIIKLNNCSKPKTLKFFLVHFKPSSIKLNQFKSLIFDGNSCWKNDFVMDFSENIWHT